MTVAPNSELKLLKCPLELDNRNQLTFDTKTEQYNYFNSLRRISVNDFTYIRKDSLIRYNGIIDDLLDYNYVMYKNDYYSDKWFYAFITKMEYVSDTLTYIYIKEDTFQSWMFEYDFLPSFIEREHVLDDTIGAHTVDEGIPTGNFVCNGSPAEYDNMKKVVTVIASTSDSNGNYYNPVGKIGNISSGLMMTYYNIHLQAGDTDFKNAIKRFAEGGRTNNIVAVFTVPILCMPSGFNYETSVSGTIADFTGVGVKEGSIQIIRNSSLDGYTPKNNKLFTGEYNFILVDNNAGNMAKYNYEYFDVPTRPEFKIKAYLSVGCSINLYPYNYKNVTYNLNESLIAGKYSICSFVGDAYTNWLTQNSLNIGIKATSSVAEILGGTALTLSGNTMLGAGLVASGLGGITSSIQEHNQASYIPNQAVGTVSGGDIFNADGKNTYTLYKMSIRSEKAKIIDDYFSMFGYKINEVDYPILSGRRNWNYVKLIEPNIDSEHIPQYATDELKQMFSNGITLWHNPNTFLDYSQNNDIL